jgi:predicted GNAT family acetyltransferase
MKTITKFAFLIILLSSFCKSSFASMTNDTSINIIDATNDNINILNQIVVAGRKYWGYGEDHLEKYKTNFAINEKTLNTTFTKIMYIDNQLIGFYAFCFNEKNEFQLKRFYLSTEFIGKGFGKKMWQKALETAVERIL